jgi:hypothetical protein
MYSELLYGRISSFICINFIPYFTLGGIRTLYVYESLLIIVIVNY